MRRNSFIYIGVLMILLVGCAKEEPAQQTLANGNMEEQLSALNDKLEESDQQIKELYTLLENNTSYENDVYQDLNTKIHMLETLLSYVPSIEVKQGFVQDVRTNDNAITMTVQFGEKIGQAAPNGFTIEEKETGTVTVDMNASYFIHEGVQLQSIRTIDDFKEVVDASQRFFTFYIVQGKVVMLAEQYVP